MENEIKQIKKEWQEFKLALCKSLKIDKLVLWISKLITKVKKLLGKCDKTYKKSLEKCERKD